MSWLSGFLHGIARAFTVPKAQRQALDANPLAQGLKAQATSAVLGAAFAAIDKSIGANSASGAAIKDALPNVLVHVGLGDTSGGASPSAAGTSGVSQ